MFPSSIVAKLISIPVYTMFEAEDAAKIEKLDAKAMFTA